MEMQKSFKERRSLSKYDKYYYLLGMEVPNFERERKSLDKTGASC